LSQKEHADVQTSRRLSDDSARDPGRGPAGDVVRRFAAHRSDLELLPSVILAGAVGNFLDFQAWFLVGRSVRPTAPRETIASGAADRERAALVRRLRDHANLAIRFMAGLDSVGTVTIGIPEGRVQRFTVLNAPGALLWAATFAVAGYLLGNLLEPALENRRRSPRLCWVGIVVLTVAWIVYHDLSDRRSRHAAGAKV
jgi:membrane protein DedA with SNARE-associated domain